MQVKLLSGYPDMVGRRRIFCGYGSGPTSYNSTTGDPVLIPGYETYIDMVFDTPQDPTGTYYARARPSAVGARATWALFWYKVSDNTPASGNLSTFQLQVSAFGGQY